MSDITAGPAPAADLGAASRQGWSRRLVRFLMAAPGILIVALAYVPLVGLLVLSFAESPMTGIPYPLTTAWYEALVTNPRWVAPLGASLVLGFAVAVACTLLSLLVARALHHLKRPGPTLLMFLFPLFVPGMVMGVALLLYYRIVLDWKLGYWSIFVGHFVWAFPFALLAMLVVSLQFDRRLKDAAADLGAGPWRVFWDVEVPLLRHGIIGAFLFAFLLSFNELPRSIQLRGTTTTLPLFEWGQAAAQTSSIPYLFAMSSIFVAVTLPLIFWLFRRLFRPSATNP